MLFLIDNALRKRRAENSEWEREADAWVKQKNEEYGYGYSRKNYERFKERPHRPAKEIAVNIFYYAAGTTVCAAAIGAIALAVSSGIEQSKKPPVCSVSVSKGDKVSITYGPFVGSKGVIEDQGTDCAVHVKLTESTNTLDKCKIRHDDCRDTVDAGGILYVDSSKNINKL